MMGVVSKTTTKEKVKSLAFKAKVTREQTSDDNDIQGGSDEDLDEEEAEAFNLMARKFVSKFLGTVRFGNDQIPRIMGYGDYKLGNIVISR
ncbi:hypothetical protein Tco_1379921, partial [Tanacetum coccineum]